MISQFILKKWRIPIEIAIQYTTAYSDNIYSFVNNINTIEGGTHLEGFKRALNKKYLMIMQKVIIF